jgi:hypothetical protein
VYMTPRDAFTLLSSCRERIKGISNSAILSVVHDFVWRYNYCNTTNGFVNVSIQKVRLIRTIIAYFRLFLYH